MPVRTVVCSKGHELSVYLSFHTLGDEDVTEWPCPCLGCDDGTVRVDDEGHGQVELACANGKTKPEYLKRGI